MSAIHQQENSLHSFPKLTGLPPLLGQPGKVECTHVGTGSSVQGAVDVQSPGDAVGRWQLRGLVRGERAKVGFHHG